MSIDCAMFASHPTQGVIVVRKTAPNDYTSLVNRAHHSMHNAPSAFAPQADVSGEYHEFKPSCMSPLLSGGMA